jgi:hypothetical protein
MRVEKMETTMIDVLDLFNCLVVDEDQFHQSGGSGIFTHVGVGVVMDFAPTAIQNTILESHFKPLDTTTLFTREERKTASLEYLLVKQILHYIEVYGLDTPGLFNLETSSGTITTMRFVKGITVTELESKVQDLLYANAPIKDAAQLKRIIEEYDLDFDINKIQNNEMRVVLYRPGKDTFQSGDDAVRYLCWQATGDALLIKSPEVIKAVAGMEPFVPRPFFEQHKLPLAQVFNRHKRLILAAKNKWTAGAINRISRLSKKKHVPVRESIAKTFIHQALSPLGRGVDLAGVLSKLSLRDKFKYLNLLEQKKVQSRTASFKIRNGKIYTCADRKMYGLQDISRVEEAVVTSLAEDLAHLKNKNILFDKNVDYGLPVSRKQTVGNLPFGTRVTSDSNEISSGMYWENAWGARDLDLSTIDLDGNRVGWGGLRGYENEGGVTFSGDMTDARNGAMEFMTSRTEDYGLFVNIYAGENGAGMELVVGTNRTKQKWVDEAFIREKHTLNSRNSVIGFVKGKTFVVYSGRLNNRRVSGDNSIVNESRADFWTIQRLFSIIGIDFDIDKRDEIVYDQDLSYSSFSFDKLEALFSTT